MKIYFSDNNSRCKDVDYHKKMDGFGTVIYNMNKALKKIGHFEEFKDAEWVGRCGSLEPNFSAGDKKTFYINTWETNNSLPNYLLAIAQGQRMFGLCNLVTSLWKKYGFDAETIYAGCDTEFWQPTREKDSNVFTFCHINHAAVRSGLEIIIKAFALAFKDNKDVKLVLKDSVPFSEKILNFIASLGIKNIEIINEFYTVEQIRELYSKSHCTINLLRSTSFGMPLLECSACKSYCLTGDVTPTNELVDKSFAKMITPKGEIEIYPFVYKLVEKYGLNNYYGSMEYPEPPKFWDFDEETVAKEFLDVYTNWSTYKNIDTRQPVIDKWKWEYSVEKLIKELSK